MAEIPWVSLGELGWPWVASGKLGGKSAKLYRNTHTLPAKALSREPKPLLLQCTAWNRRKPILPNRPHVASDWKLQGASTWTCYEVRSWGGSKLLVGLCLCT